MTTSIAIQKELVETIEVNGHRLRRVKAKGLICVRDILDAVGIKKTAEWIKRLDIVSSDVVSSDVVLEYYDIGQAGKAAFTNEDGLLEILSRSRKPAATAKLHEIINELKARASATPALDVTQIVAQVLEAIMPRIAALELNQGWQLMVVDTKPRQLPAPLPDKSSRTILNDMVLTQAKCYHRDDYQYVYTWLYREHKAIFHIDLVAIARERGLKSVLDAAEQMGEIDHLISVAKKLFGMK